MARPARIITQPRRTAVINPDSLAEIETWAEHAYTSIEAVRLLASGDLLGEPVRTMVGFSNLRSGGPYAGGRALEKKLLAGLKSAGLSHILANALDDTLRFGTNSNRIPATGPRGHPGR